MKGKTSVMLMVALTLGIVTAWAGLNLVRQNQPSAQTNKTIKVLVASHDLDPGKEIEGEDVEAAVWPAETAPKNAFKDIKDVVGRTVVSPIVANQPLLDGLITAPGAPNGLQALVPEGMRAVTVEVNESSGVAGLLTQGARVDVISTLRHGDKTISKTIVENVKVTAVGRRLVRDPKDDSANAVRTVTLVMSPKNAEAIELASTNGRPRLVLRGSQDNAPTASPGVSLDELVGGFHTGPVGDAFGPGPGSSLSGPGEDAFAPTTQPTASSDFQNSFVRRPVQIIRGGNESTIYYEVRAAPVYSGGAVSESPKSRIP